MLIVPSITVSIPGSRKKVDTKHRHPFQMKLAVVPCLALVTITATQITTHYKHLLYHELYHRWWKISMFIANPAGPFSPSCNDVSLHPGMTPGPLLLDILICLTHSKMCLLHPGMITRRHLLDAFVSFSSQSLSEPCAGCAAGRGAGDYPGSCCPQWHNLTPARNRPETFPKVCQQLFYLNRRINDHSLRIIRNLNVSLTLTCRTRRSFITDA